MTFIESDEEEDDGGIGAEDAIVVPLELSVSITCFISLARGNCDGERDPAIETLSFCGIFIAPVQFELFRRIGDEDIQVQARIQNIFVQNNGIQIGPTDKYNRLSKIDTN